MYKGRTLILILCNVSIDSRVGNKYKGSEARRNKFMCGNKARKQLGPWEYVDLFALGGFRQAMSYVVSDFG